MFSTDRTPAAHLVRFRKELLHDVTLPNHPYRTHCRERRKAINERRYPQPKPFPGLRTVSAFCQRTLPFHSSSDRQMIAGSACSPGEYLLLRHLSPLYRTPQHLSTPLLSSTPVNHSPLSSTPQLFSPVPPRLPHLSPGTPPGPGAGRPAVAPTGRRATSPGAWGR